MKNLRDAPAVVIGFAYLILTLPSLFLALPTIFVNNNGGPAIFQLGFDFRNPAASILSFLYQIYRFGPVIPLLLFIITLIICIIFGARKVNSLIVFYFVSFFIGMINIITSILYTQTSNNIYVDDRNSSILFSFPSISNTLIQTIISTIATSVFLLTVLYFLNRYKKLGKTVETVTSEVSIRDVLKKQ